ncbi:Hypothetical protein, DUF2714 family [Metamycoplasma auris 15026]|uniref:DUF2714 domain-containing protein n=1 Tax=Metamycoplasma auris 15026 TaxID=1188233 RepID=N9V079_9BACT|nr:DUF2714 domain-containing protein [Metamycoplasma auris]ENY68822.1 Hypothetical protein, DUF2714 family [Metamycoplasma auris 15026]
MHKKPEIVIEKNKEKILFFLEESKMLQTNNFIDYNKFLSTILLKTKLNSDDKNVLNFINKIKNSLENFESLILEDITIAFLINEKFSFDKKVPFIIKNEKKQPSVNLFEQAFNLQLQELIKDNYYIEFLPNIVLYFSSNAQDLKLYIKKSYFN